MDVQGPEAARPYAEDRPFITVVDAENQLANFFGFKIVPNGIFIDEEGNIRMIQQGLYVSNEEHTDAVKQLITEEAETVELDDAYYKPARQISDLEKQLAQTKFKLGMEYVHNGKKIKL